MDKADLCGPVWACDCSLLRFNFSSHLVLEAMKSANNPHIFQLCYSDLCSSHNIPMIFSIKAHLHKKTLEFNADRVKLDEWRPILKALSLDRSLHFISIQSKHLQSKVLDDMDSETKCRSMRKVPVLFSSFIFRKLIISLTNCVSYNFHLKCLELDGLQLTKDYLTALIMGLRKNSSIQHLSLHRCPLGDSGCELVCHYLRFSPNIVSINMSGCNLSERGAYFIAKTLEFQNLNRYVENWKQSLRYRNPNTDTMPGLRRVTLNNNQNIGDLGVQHFINVLKDDLWLKALDLQNVGLTNSGGRGILNLLQTSKCLSVLDAQNNPGLDDCVLHGIMSQLASNNKGRIPEHHWIKEDTLFLKRKQASAQSSVKIQVTSDEGRISNRPAAAPRLTQSSILPSKNHSTDHQIQKAHSACVIHVSQSAQHNRRGLLSRHTPHFQRVASRHVVRNHQQLRSDHLYGAGDINTLEEARAKIREMSKRLEEESQKRLDAERQKDILERKHKLFIEEYKKIMSDQVVMDKSIVEEISEAFADFNQFLYLISESGLGSELHLSGLKSPEGLSTIENEFSTQASSSISAGTEKIPNSEFHPKLDKDLLVCRASASPRLGDDESLLSSCSIDSSKKDKQIKSFSSVRNMSQNHIFQEHHSILHPPYDENGPKSFEQRCLLENGLSTSDDFLTSSKEENFSDFNFIQNSFSSEDSNQNWLTVSSSDDQ